MVEVFEFYNEETKEWLDQESPKWHQAVLDKFSWIRQLQSNTAVGEEPAPRDYATLNDDDNIQIRDFNTIKNKYDALRQHISLTNNGEHMTNIGKTTMIEDYPSTFTWRDLFLKLCFEQML